MEVTFKIIATERRNSAATHMIAVVAPLSAERHDTTGRSKAFKDLFRDLATRQHIPHARINTYYFDIADLFSGAVSAHDLSFALVEMLVTGHREADEKLDLRKAKPSLQGAHKAAPYSRAQGTTPLPILFVAQGIGSWVVKDLLSTTEHAAVSIAQNTRGVIFLDTPIGEQEYTLPGMGHYLDILQSFWRGRAGKKRDTESLAKQLHTINLNFKLMQESTTIRNAKGHADGLPNITTRYLYAWPKNSRRFRTAYTQNNSKQRRFKFRKLLRGRKGEVHYDEVHCDEKDLDAHMELDVLLKGLREMDPKQHQPPADIHTQSLSQKHTEEAPECIPPVPDATHIASQSGRLLAPMITPSELDSTPILASLTKPSPLKSLEHSTTTTSQPKAAPSVSFGNNPISSVASTTPILSHPTVLEKADQMRKEQIDSELKQGKRSLWNSKYIEAEDCLLTCNRLLVNYRGPDFHYLCIAVDVQLAAVSLYLGRQSEAYDDFGRLLEKARRLENIQASTKTALVQDLERWRAVVLLHQGHYREAADKFNILLRQSNDCWLDDPESWKVFRISIQRDISLAMAYLGPYSAVSEQLQSAKRELSSYIRDETSIMRGVDPVDAREPGEDEIDYSLGTMLLAEIDHFYFTEAIIYSLWGFEDEALSKSSKALKRLEERLGRTHIMTLECAGLNALLLAKNSQLYRAQTLARETLKTMEESDLASEKEEPNDEGPERYNPSILETSGRLVHIYNLTYHKDAKGKSMAQSEAVLLQAAAEEGFGQQHPQTLKSRLLLSEVQLTWGDYGEAVMGLRDLSQTSKSIYGDEHLTTLVIYSTYARALLRAGAIQEAEKVALWTLQRQRGGLSLCGSTDVRPLGESLSNTTMLINETLEIVDEHGTDLRVHPSLLLTLETIALVEYRKNKPNWQLAKKIMECCWRRKSVDLGAFNICTLTTQFELAMSLPVNFDEEKKYSEREHHLRNVYRGRMIVLGPDHPETLIAKRELIANSCGLGIWRNPPDFADIYAREMQIRHVERFSLQGASTADGRSFDDEIWEFVGIESERTYRLHRDKLNDTHPETLKSMLWVLKLQVISDWDLENDSYLGLLLSRLRQPEVLRQRLVDSVGIRLELVPILLERCLLVPALAILHLIRRDIDESPSSQDPVFQDEVDMLRRVTSQYLLGTKERALPIHEPELNKLQADFNKAVGQRGDHEEARRHIPEIVKLCEALYGPEDVRTFSARKDQAMLAWDPNDESKKKDAIKTMEELRYAFKVAGEVEQERQVDDVLNEWKAAAPES